MPDAGFEYDPRHPEGTVLYGVIAGELESFLATQLARDRPVPKFVEDEFRSFLECGILAHGFVRVRCDSCGHSRLVPFSCRRRGWCPSCGGRRMAETAARLVDYVIPVVPVRQWVLSVPFALRYRLAYDSSLLSDVLNVFLQVVFGQLRRRARQLLGLESSQCGAVTFVQRFGDALRLAPHFHSMVIDGVYAAGADGQPEFHELPAPEDAEVVEVATGVARRVEALLQRRGLGPGSDPDTEEPLSRDEPGLAAIYSAAVRSTIGSGSHTGNRVVRSGDQIDGTSLDSLQSPRCATVSGFSVHGNVAIPAHDRMRLERLARYAARPAVSTERLSELPDGRLLYRLKRRWRNGTTEVVFERMDFMAKLAALVPAPRAHLTRFHGILAPAAKWRSTIVPSPDEVPFGACPHAPAATKAARQKANETHVLQFQSSRPPKNYSWSALLKRVFEIDVLVCQRCGGPVRVIAAIQEPQTAEKILNCLGLPAKPPPTAPARDRHCPVPKYL